MDPASAVGLAASATSLVGFCYKAVNELHTLHSKQSRAGVTLVAIRRECATLAAAAEGIISWTETREARSVSRQNQCASLNAALQGLTPPIKALNDDVERILRKVDHDTGALPITGRITFVWREEDMKAHLEEVRWQAQHVHLLLTTIQLSAGEATRELRRLDDAVSEHYSRNDMDNQSVISQTELTFDDQVVNSRAYRRALLAAGKKSAQLPPVEENSLKESISEDSTQISRGATVAVNPAVTQEVTQPARCTKESPDVDPELEIIQEQNALAQDLAGQNQFEQAIGVWEGTLRHLKDIASTEPAYMCQWAEMRSRIGLCYIRQMRNIKPEGPTVKPGLMQKLITNLEAFKGEATARSEASSLHGLRDCCVLLLQDLCSQPVTSLKEWWQPWPSVAKNLFSPLVSLAQLWMAQVLMITFIERQEYYHCLMSAYLRLDPQRYLRRLNIAGKFDRGLLMELEFGVAVQIIDLPYQCFLKSDTTIASGPAAKGEDILACARDFIIRRWKICSTYYNHPTPELLKLSADYLQKICTFGRFLDVKSFLAQIDWEPTPFAREGGVYLGFALWLRGEFDDALKLLRRTLKAAQSFTHEDPGCLYDHMMLMGTIYSRRGEEQIAKSYDKRIPDGYYHQDRKPDTVLVKLLAMVPKLNDIDNSVDTIYKNDTEVQCDWVAELWTKRDDPEKPQRDLLEQLRQVKSKWAKHKGKPRHGQK